MSATDHHQAARTVCLFLFLMVGMLVAPSGALAVSAPIHISGTEGEGVLIRSGPGTSYTAVGWMPEGASPDYNCFVWGQDINGTPIWFSVNYNGKTGYYASFYDDSSYHSNEELTDKYGVPLCGSTPPMSPSPAPAPAPSPAAGLVFSVFNAEGGIYYRKGPHWNEAIETPGVGIYNGDQVEVICGAFGDPVGPYNDTAWSKVRNLTRSGEGWVNEHFIDDGAPDNGFVSGEPMCAPEASGGGTTGGGTPGGGSSGDGTSGLRPGGSLYFSPYNGKNIQIHPVQGWGIVDWVVNKALHQTAYVPSPATLATDIGEWNAGGGGSCTHPGASVVPYQLNEDSYNGRLITTVAAWSIARSAPLLFLQQFEFASEIHYVLLFDPGDREEYATSNCPRSMYTRLAQWLGENPANRLVVLAGKVTADYENPVNGHAHAGIQNYLFPPIREYPNVRGQNIRRQVVVCNYDNMTHENVWRNFRGMMNQAPITLSTCPKASPGEHVVSWNP